MRWAMSWHEILPNIFTWSWFSEEKGFNFNGYCVQTQEGIFIIDPPPLDNAVWHEIESRGYPQAIYLTNKDHTRTADEFKQRYDCPVWIHEADRSLCNIEIDRTFQDGQKLAGNFYVIHLEHLKSPGESALLWQEGAGVLFIGDALIGNPPGELNLLPPAKVPDPKQAKTSLKKLLNYQYESVLVGDGKSFHDHGKLAIQAFLER